MDLLILRKQLLLFDRRFKDVPPTSLTLFSHLKMDMQRVLMIIPSKDVQNKF